jgi:hypothetical protein
VAKEALYLIHTELDAAVVPEWSVFQAGEHAPAVVKAGGFLGAQRYRHPGDAVRFTIAYRAANLAAVRAYLEGGEVGKMRALHEAWLAAHHATVRQVREVLEENWSVGADAKPLARDPSAAPGRAAFVVRVRVDPGNAGTWSNWYDREHMPKVVVAGGFLRAGRWRLVEETAAAPRFVVIYEAPSSAVVSAFRSGKGPELSKEHESRFGAAVAIEGAQRPSDGRARPTAELAIEREVWGETE